MNKSTEKEGNLCEYFKANREKDSNIFYIGDVLFCANEKCPYDNHVGKTYQLNGTGNPICECETNGLKKLEETVVQEPA